MSSPRLRTAVLAVTGLVLAACGSGTSNETEQNDTDALTIATAFYPITEIVTSVTAETSVNVVSLTPAGVGAHDHQLTAKQLDELSQADVVFYLGAGLQPSVEKAVEQLPATITVVDLLDSAVTVPTAEKADDDSHNDEHEEGKESTAEDEHGDEHAHGDVDPHVWLDPANVARMTRTVVATLTQIDATQQTQYENNANTYIAELDVLGDEMDNAFTTCTSRALVTSHDAFGYFAARAKLETIPIAGVNPENEPSAKELESIAEVAKDAQAATVFFEALLPDGLANTVANAIGAKVDVIDPIETIAQSDLDQGETYVSVQRTNIQKIAAGLGCS